MIMSVLLFFCSCQSDPPNHLVSDLDFTMPPYRGDSLLGVRVSDEMRLGQDGDGITKDRFVSRYANFRLNNLDGIMSLLLDEDPSNKGDLRIIRYDLVH